MTMYRPTSGLRRRVDSKVDRNASEKTGWVTVPSARHCTHFKRIVIWRRSHLVPIFRVQGSYAIMNRLDLRSKNFTNIFWQIIWFKINTALQQTN